MKEEKQVSEESRALQDAFVKTILHRCVDLEWTSRKLCQEAKVSQGHWSEIRRFKKSPGIDTVVRLCIATGLQIQFGIASPVTGEEGA